MDKQRIAQEVERTFDALISTVTAIEAQYYNAVPFEGSWTAGQVVQHINLSNDGFVAVIDGEVADIDRLADEKVANLKDIFLNYEIKMKSPAFILPKLERYDQDAQLVKINAIKTRMSEQTETLPLDKSCISFELPGMGFLTRLEAIYFVIYHTQRHTHQLHAISHMPNLS
jgi:uncharacterized damage-inducible protein DinB